MATTIDTPEGLDDNLKSILERLMKDDKMKDELLKILWLPKQEILRLFEILQEDKKMREERNSSEHWKLINSLLEYSDKIGDKIKTMKESVDKNAKKEVHKTIFRGILSEYNKFGMRLQSLIDEWTINKNITVSDIRPRILKFIKTALAKRGRISWMMRYLAYSRVPSIKDKNQMENHWIDVSLLESICSDITKMLNELNVKVFFPAVLVDLYDIKRYDYENDDTFIKNLFDVQLPCDVVQDIFKIGYEIRDEKGNIIESRKPLVKYRR